MEYGREKDRLKKSDINVDVQVLLCAIGVSYL